MKKRKKSVRRRKKPKKNPVLKKRQLTIAETQNARLLAEQLGALIPLAGYRSSFSLVNIAKEFKVQKYITKKTVNKKETFSSFIEDVLCYKPRTLKKIIRSILPRAIEKRHREGNPVLEQEAKALGEQLLKLSIDMRSEITCLNLPKERPRIVPPPIEIQKILEAYKLHPTLLPDCQKMFCDGHINESVNNPDKKYQLKSLPGDFTGMQLLSYMYVGLKQLEPGMDSGIDLEKEYRRAVELFNEPSDKDDKK